MIVSAYVNAGTNDATDFENNYKSQAVQIDSIVVGGGTIDFLKRVSYTDFKTYIDGEVVKWSDVKYKDWGNFYELFLVVS